MKCNLCGAEVMEGTRCPVCYEMSPVAPPAAYVDAGNYSGVSGYSEANTAPRMRPFTKVIIWLILIGSTLGALSTFPMIWIGSAYPNSKGSSVSLVVFSILLLIVEVGQIVLCLLTLRGKRKAAKILTILYLIGIVLTVLGFLTGQYNVLVIVQIYFAYKLIKEPWENFT